MKLLECKDKLTINELLQIAFEYGNDNADMPADSDSITESFNEWLKSNDDLFKKLILPQVSKSDSIEREISVCDCKHSHYHIEEMAVVVCTDCGELLGKQTDC